MNDRPEFVRHLAFSKPWRPYQQRAIDNFAGHIADRHFHLVAAPGSGKTVMGLEAMRLIGKPTLVLTPTLAIREQWVKRLNDDFLPPGYDEFSWLSRDIKAPRELTLSTYQALASEFRRGGREALLDRLREAGASVIIVDEAHHLRSFWWKCLNILKENLTDIHIIALTATPPIDVPQAEWNRYASFCGPIDEEVGVPELVAEGNLCPHQDYVYFSLPSGPDIDVLRDFQGGVAKLILDLQLDTAFASRLIAFPSWVPEDPSRDFLRSHQDFYLALAIYLTKTAGYLPAAIGRHYPVTGIELPNLDPVWMQALLQGLLFDFRPSLDKICDPALQSDLKRWTARVQEIGGIEKSQVVLVNAAGNERILRSSPSKLDSIVAIIEHETAALGLSLRALVLTDFIRREAFPTGLTEAIDQPLQKMGVVPIFERLRRLRLTDVVPAILSGTLVVVPATTTDGLRRALLALGATEGNLMMKPLAHAPDFIEVTVRESDRQRMVEAVTELHRTGEVNCLIGTASLLGEGWDAPRLNTLVLASVVGSFVRSNQMRGRAIRTDPNDPHKIANIWHLATLNPTWSHEPVKSDSGADFAILKRRFDAFHGVAHRLDESGKARIENGLARLGWDRAPHADEAFIADVNAETCRLAEDRYAMGKVWQQAIAPRLEGRFLRPVRTLSTPPALVRIRFTALLGERDTGVRASIRRWLKVRRLRLIAEAVLASLIECLDLDLDSEINQEHLRVTHTGRSILVSLPGADERVQACLVRSLEQFYDLFDNPRYLLQTKQSYHAVPEFFGTHRDRARLFSSRLSRAIGRHQLIYVHQGEGLSHLLAARQASLLSHHQLRTSASVRWDAEDTPSTNTTDGYQ